MPQACSLSTKIGWKGWDNYRLLPYTSCFSRKKLIESVELPRRCIQLFSYIGDIVLDPFLGSGTTLVTSFLYDRNGIGIEVDPRYCRIGLKRLIKETEIDLENTKKPVIHTDEKNKTKKYRITQSDIILQYFKDRPSQFFHYNNIRD